MRSGRSAAPSIRCLPRGICSWAFVLDGAGHRGSLEFNWMSEQGVLVADGEALEIEKHGMGSGRWSLLDGGAEVVTAHKRSIFSRTFDIEGPMGALELSAVSAVGRTFELGSERERVATLRPDHAFTRRATIRLSAQEFDFPTIGFAAWLAILTWRRAAQNNS